jgi:hypothetical protein
MDQRTLSSEQQSEGPAPIVAAESPHVETPPRVPETADVVIMGEMHTSICIPTGGHYHEYSNTEMEII